MIRLILCVAASLVLGCGDGGSSGSSGTANAACESSLDCLASETCVAEADIATNTVTQICRTRVGMALTGESCAADADCESDSCGTIFGAATLCLGPCDAVMQDGCVAGTSCYPNVIYEQFAVGPAGREGDLFDSYSACEVDSGTYDLCAMDGDCVLGEHCSLKFNEDRTAIVGRCLANVGVALGGQVCAANADCQSGQCIPGGSGMVCFGFCQITADCPSPATCTLSLTIDDMGTAATADDLVAMLCEMP